MKHLKIKKKNFLKNKINNLKKKKKKIDLKIKCCIKIYKK